MQEVTYKGAERAIINRTAADGMKRIQSGAFMMIVISSFHPGRTHSEPFPGPVLVSWRPGVTVNTFTARRLGWFRVGDKDPSACER